MRCKLSPYFQTLYTNKKGFVAHEFIIDLKDLKLKSGVTEEDIAKKLMDYGFHAPTMSFPVPSSFMIEPTGSENLGEINRLIDSLISIRKEIDKVISGEFDKLDNPIKNAPYSLEELTNNNWEHKYTREEAGYPMEFLKSRGKTWPACSRINNMEGDRKPIFD